MEKHMIKMRIRIAALLLEVRWKINVEIPNNSYQFNFIMTLHRNMIQQ